MHKNDLGYPSARLVLQVFTPTMGQIFLGEII